MVDATNTGLVRAIINMSDADVGNNPNDKNSSEEYFDRRQQGDEQNQDNFGSSRYVDRSAQLQATLASLANLNAVNVIKSNYELVRKEKNKQKEQQVLRKEEEKEEKK